MARRSAGLILHPTSLPGPFGIGDLGPEAEKFLDWAASAGQGLWQILPLHPTGPGDSPYAASSAFAGNPLLLSPERLREEGLLSRADLADVPVFPRDRVDYASVRSWKERLLRRSWKRFLERAGAREELETFRIAPERAPWLSDWAFFAALKTRLAGTWTSWREGLSRRRSEALAAAARELADEIAYQEYLQLLFFRQWERVRVHASHRGIAILGDVPIFLAHDSADVWARRELFALDESGTPEMVAGVPPDSFSAAGQLWGYPLYRWERMEEEGFAWWISRIRTGLSAADILRIDHFRGFAACWGVPAGEKTASNGRWLPGPGRRLFDAVRAELGEVPIVAEDLGTITRDVRELLAALGIPGMKVLQFAFSQTDSEHLPRRHVANAVVYTGTHDNDTARGWFAALPAAEKARALDCLGGDGSEIEWDMIRAAYDSVADRAIVPLQDVFGLGSQARMNTPGRARGNWTWRALDTDFTEARAARLKSLAESGGRAQPA